jgi:CBS domain-containing protein
MDVSEVMTREIVGATPDMNVEDAARLMVQHRLSGLPVLVDGGVLVGIITEGDLLRRAEIGTAGEGPGWLTSFFTPGRGAQDYIRTHARKVGDLMTRDVVSVSEGTSLSDAVSLMQSRHVKRLPVAEQGRLVGIVARADLLKALVKVLPIASPCTVPDAELSKCLSAEMTKQGWLPRANFGAGVKNGVVTYFGTIQDEWERTALHVIAENIAGVKDIRDDLVCIEPMSGVAIDRPPAT